MVNTNPSTCSIIIFFRSLLMNREQKGWWTIRKKERKKADGREIDPSSKAKFRGSTVLMKWPARYFSRALKYYELERATIDDRWIVLPSLLSIFFHQDFIISLSRNRHIRQVRYDCSQLLFVRENFFLHYSIHLRYDRSMYRVESVQ